MSSRSGRHQPYTDTDDGRLLVFYVVGRWHSERGDLWIPPACPLTAVKLISCGCRRSQNRKQHATISRSPSHQHPLHFQCRILVTSSSCWHLPLKSHIKTVSILVNERATSSHGAMPVYLASYIDLVYRTAPLSPPKHSATTDRT